MKMALEVADREGADIVLATDPDADRMGIAVRDNDGKMVQFNGNQTCNAYLLHPHTLEGTRKAHP